MTGMDGAILVPAHSTNIITSRRNVPKVNVYHTPEEPADDIEVTPGYFQRPNLGASTHYYDDSDGDLYQMVDEDDGALANGVLGRPYPADTDPSYSLNYQSRSIEMEGYAATIHLTCWRGSPQWLTAVRFCLAGHLMHGIPIDRAHNIGHYEVSVERSDPGLLDLDAIVEDARRMLEDDMTEDERELLRLTAKTFVLDTAELSFYTEDEQTALMLDRLRRYHAAVPTSLSGRLSNLEARLDNASDV